VKDDSIKGVFSQVYSHAQFYSEMNKQSIEKLAKNREFVEYLLGAVAFF